MLKSEFEKIPNGTIFKIPGVRKVFVKAQVYFEEQYLALPYDGRRNILLIKDIPEDIKIEKGDPNLLYVPERDEKNYLEMCEKNNKKLDEIDRIQREMENCYTALSSCRMRMVTLYTRLYILAGSR